MKKRLKRAAALLTVLAMLMVNLVLPGTVLQAAGTQLTPEIAEGLELKAAIYGKNKEEKTTFDLDETVFVYYQIIDKATGAVLDDTETQFKTQVEFCQPGGAVYYTYSYANGDSTNAKDSYIYGQARFSGACTAVVSVIDTSAATEGNKVRLTETLSFEVGYGLRTWISDEKLGEELDVIPLNSYAHCCYQIVGSTGGLLIDDNAMTYQTEVKFYQPDGVLFTEYHYDSASGLANNCSIFSLVHMVGTWTAVVTVTGDVEFEETLTFEVVDYDIHIWRSRSRMGEVVTDTPCSNTDNYPENTYFFCYELVEASTGERVTDDLNYVVRVEAFRPDGTSASLHIYRHSWNYETWCEGTSTSYCFGQARLDAPGEWKIVVNVTGDITLKKVYTVEAYNTAFEWGKDNLSFNNLGSNFANSYDFDNAILDQLADEIGMSPTDRESLRMLKNNFIQTKNEGSCFGMTTLMMLVHDKKINLSNYGLDSTLYNNSNTAPIVSLANIMYLFQNVSDFNQAGFNAVLAPIPYDSQAVLIAAIEKATQYNELLNVGLPGHSVLAYGMEVLDEPYHSNITGKDYDRRILIADPNEMKKETLTDNCCLYYDSKDYSWIVPYYNFTRQDGTFHPLYWNADEGFATPHGRINYALRRNADGVLGDVVDVPAFTYTNGINLFTDNQPSNGSYNKTKNGSYQLNGTAGNFVIEQENFAVIGKYKNGTTLNTIYDTPGMRLTGTNLVYDVALVTNEALCTTDWYKLTLKGGNTNKLECTVTADGYVLTADKLESIYVAANNSTALAEATFSTDYTTVLIYEVDANTIGVAADADGDGNWDTDIIGSKYTEAPTDPEPTDPEPTDPEPTDPEPTDPEPTDPELPDVLPLGDVNGDGLVDAGDAAHILVECALTGSGAPGTYTDAQMAAADADGNGVVDAGDSSFILTYAAACGSNVFKGTLEEYLEQYLANLAA